MSKFKKAMIFLQLKYDILNILYFFKTLFFNLVSNLFNIIIINNINNNS